MTTIGNKPKPEGGSGSGDLSSARIGDISGGDYTEFETDGTAQAIGEATCWDDLTNSLIGRRLSAVAGTVDYNWEENSITFSRNGDILDVNDRLVLNFQKPHAAKTDSVTYFHIHWEQTTADDLEFTLRYRIQENGGPKTTAWTTETISTDANNVFSYTSGTLNQITNLVTIDWADCPLSSTVQVQFTRTDAVNVPAEVTFADSHVEYDMNGSREVFTK